MSELRLVPAALAAWAVTLVVLLTGALWWVIAGLGILGMVLVWLREPGQAVLSVTVGSLTAVTARMRQRQAENWEPGETLVGTLSAAPVSIDGGHQSSYLVRLDIDGFPVPLPLFTEDLPAGISAGTQVLAQVSLSESTRPGVGTYLANGQVQVLAEPTGMSAVAAHVRKEFSQAVENTVGESSRGLFPGMVLGDTSAQSASETQLYIDTGLSHLSAVSGANVTLITTAAIMMCRMLTLGPRVQGAAAAGALLIFVGLVGTEPSVLRASVTGLVGLLAVVSSTRMEPIHGLCLAVIGLVFWDSDLAVSYGFALSVAATAGIIVLFPLLYRPLAGTRLPDILVRAIAVAIAADIVTMPIIALMTEQVSLVSVAANILVAAAVPPVTILGLIAALCAVLPGGLEYLPLKLAESCTWWIHTVASLCAQLPHAIVSASPGWVLLGYGWVIAGILSGHPWKTTAVLSIWFLLAARGADLPPEVPLESLHLHVVDTVEEVDSAPGGTQVIVVRIEEGSPADRPTVTREGVPVLFPARDGDVNIHVDGSQHARDGRF